MMDVMIFIWSLVFLFALFTSDTFTALDERIASFISKESEE